MERTTRWSAVSPSISISVSHRRAQARALSAARLSYPRARAAGRRAGRVPAEPARRPPMSRWSSGRTGSSARATRRRRPQPARYRPPPGFGSWRRGGRPARSAPPPGQRLSGAPPASRSGKAPASGLASGMPRRHDRVPRIPFVRGSPLRLGALQPGQREAAGRGARHREPDPRRVRRSAA